MIETVLGGIVGGAFRMAPEILKWADRKNERAHELAMFDKQLDADKLKVQSAQSLAQMQADASLNIADLQAIIEATKAQAVQTGIGWVDAISSLMRPVLTFYWCIVLYTVALACQYVVLIDQGQAAVQAILALWGSEEKAMVSSMLSFWFVDRAMRKGFSR